MAILQMLAGALIFAIGFLMGLRIGMEIGES
jgi:hypothetical protein